MKEPFFLLLLELSRVHANRSREEFQKLDLSEGQPKILYILLKQDGYTQKELARLCRVRPSTLAVMLEKMEKKKYIYKEKVIVSGGKRAYQVYLTEEGRVIAQKVEQLTDELDRECLKGLSEQEQDSLYQAMKKITKNL